MSESSSPRFQLCAIIFSTTQDNVTDLSVSLLFNKIIYLFCNTNKIKFKSSFSFLDSPINYHEFRRRTEDETEPRKNKCSLPMALAATVVIGAIQISNVPLVEAAVVKPTVIKETAPWRWSDKRACPPWLQNSLETIVPENLPRPSSRRRLELAGLGKRDAPPVGAVVTRARKAACFSM